MDASRRAIRRSSAALTATPGAHHLSLSDPHRGGDPAFGHAERDREILGRRGLVELPQPGDDRHAARLRTGFPTRPMPRPGAWCWAAWRSWSSCCGRARAKALRLRIAWPRWTPEIKEFFKAFGAVTFGAASVLIAPFIDTSSPAFCRPAAAPRFIMPTASTSCRWACSASRWARCCCRKCRRGWRKGDRAGSDAAQNRSAALTLLLTLPFAAAFLAIPGTIMRGGLRPWRLRHAAPRQLAALALAAYGAGLPAIALVRIVASTFYARHDTATPARATVIAIVCQHRAEGAVRLGLASGRGGRRAGHRARRLDQCRHPDLVGPQPEPCSPSRRRFVRALPPVLLAALATGAGAWSARGLAIAGGARAIWRDMAGAGCRDCLRRACCYGAVVLVFRSRLPLGRLAR